MFKVLGYSLEDGWNLRAIRYSELAARAAAGEVRRDYQFVAVVLVRDPAHNPHLTVIDANVPRPHRLLAVEQFRRVALAL